MKTKTSNLTGSALDWAAAKCEGPNSVAACYYVDDLPVYLDEAPIPEWKPSTNWAQGGPIIEREVLAVRAESIPKGDPVWVACLTFPSMFTDEIGTALSFCLMRGPTPLIAAMRCYVASQLGDEVEVPEELA
jgi:hypothetical protein